MNELFRAVADVLRDAEEVVDVYWSITNTTGDKRSLEVAMWHLKLSLENLKKAQNHA